MRFFVSYARADRPKVDPFTQRLRQTGNDAWLDIDLVGGQEWWDSILQQIREAHAFIAIVSRSSLRSEACRIERQYAARLGKPILPLAFELLSPGTLPSDISRLQIVDYSQPDEDAAYALFSAIMRLPAPPPLPDPLPEPPDAPKQKTSNGPGAASSTKPRRPYLLAFVYKDETTAESVVDKERRRLAADLILQPDAIAAISRDKEGTYRYKHGHYDAPGPGSGWGRFWSLLFDVLFSGSKVLGMPVSLRRGRVMREIVKFGIDEQFKEQVRDLVKPGTSALFMLDMVAPYRANEYLSPYGGTVLKTSLSNEAERELRAVLH
jgi:uncharacterized membrane protein